METSYTVKTPKGEFALKREDFIELGFTMCLPEFLVDLSEDERREKLPASQQSAVAKTDSDSRVSFVLHQAEIDGKHGLDDDSLTINLMAKQKQAISRLAPGYRYCETLSKKIDDHTVICLEFISNALDGDLYNIFFLLVHESRMIFGTFSCRYEDAGEMNYVFLMCLNTLQF